MEGGNYYLEVACGDYYLEVACDDSNLSKILLLY